MLVTSAAFGASPARRAHAGAVVALVAEPVCAHFARRAIGSEITRSALVAHASVPTWATSAAAADPGDASPVQARLARCTGRSVVVPCAIVTKWAGPHIAIRACAVSIHTRRAVALLARRAWQARWAKVAECAVRAIRSNVKTRETRGARGIAVKVEVTRTRNIARRGLIAAQYVDCACRIVRIVGTDNDAVSGKLNKYAELVFTNHGWGRQVHWVAASNGCSTNVTRVRKHCSSARRRSVTRTKGTDEEG